MNGPLQLAALFHRGASMRFRSIFGLLVTLLALPAWATVIVQSPPNRVIIGTTVNYQANAVSRTCSKGISSMSIYLDSKLIYHVHGDSLSTSVLVKPGKHKTVIQEWDHCGGSSHVARQIQSTSQLGVNVTIPANSSNVSSPVNFIATANTACAAGISAMAVFIENQIAYASTGSNLNTQVPLSPGLQSGSIEEWDNCGGTSTTPIQFTVLGGAVNGGPGTALYNIQAASAWKAYPEYPPTYAICTANCAGVSWSMVQNIATPSLSGNATQFNIGGTVPYTDLLFTNPVLGQFSSQGIPDSNHQLLPTLHNFTYDADFFVTNLSITQVLEFDISMYMNSVGMIWGTQCNNLGGGSNGAVWDIWNNVSGAWVSTGVPCNLNNNAWNHITIQAQRQPDDTLLYESITLNGTTSLLNASYPPYTAPTGWWGVTLNYQMDGNYNEASNTTYVDNLTFTYW